MNRLIWLSGSAILLILLVVGRLRGLAAVRVARPLQEEQLQILIATSSEKVGLKRKVRTLISDRIRVPVVFGCWPPHLILPESFIEASPVHVKAILVHELAHIKRHDVLTQSLAQLMCCLHWPNPLAWMAERRLMIERERACDDVVLLSGGRASDYARTLMDTAGALRSTRNPVWAIAAMAEGTDFKDRVLSILDPNAQRDKPPISSAMISAGLALLVAALVAAAQPFTGIDLGGLPLPIHSSTNRETLQIEPDQEQETVLNNDRRLPSRRIEDAVAPEDGNEIVGEQQQASAVGDLFDAIGEVVMTSASDDEQAEAEVVQEVMSSIGGIVRKGENEQAVKNELARFFKSLGKLMVIPPSGEPDQSQPDQQASEGKPRQEGNTD